MTHDLVVLSTTQTAGAVAVPDYVATLISAVVAFLRANRDDLVARAADILGARVLRFVPRALRVRAVALAYDAVVLALARLAR